MREGIGHPTAVGLARTYWEGDVASVAAPRQAARSRNLCEGIGHPTAVGLARPYREGDGASVGAPHHAARSRCVCEGIGHPTAVGLASRGPFPRGIRGRCLRTCARAITTQLL